MKDGGKARREDDDGADDAVPCSAVMRRKVGNCESSAKC